MKGRLRGDGQGSVLFVSFIPITPRAPFGPASRVPSSARAIQIETNWDESAPEH